MKRVEENADFFFEQEDKEGGRVVDEGGVVVVALLLLLSPAMLCAKQPIQVVFDEGETSRGHNEQAEERLEVLQLHLLSISSSACRPIVRSDTPPLSRDEPRDH